LTAENDARRLLADAIAHEQSGNFRAAQDLAERAACVAAPASLRIDIEVVRARLSSTLGDFESAEARLAAALTLACGVLPDDHPCMLAIHNMRGITAKYAGRFDDAAAPTAWALAILEAGPVVDSDALAGLLHNLGGLEHSRGRIAEGLVHAERGLRLRIEAVGPDHPDVARDLNAIGALHHDAADSTAAVTAYRRALEIFEKTLGPDHYEVAMTCANLAVSTAAAADARRLYERALDILEPTLGVGHPDVALVQHNFAVLLADQDDVDTALDLLTRADAALAAALPQDHPRRLDVLATVKTLSSRNVGKARETPDSSGRVRQ
jgi:tetratricopeptide (TPR) repeat protein